VIRAARDPKIIVP